MDNDNKEKNINSESSESTAAPSKNKKSAEKRKKSLGRELFEWFYTIIIAAAIAFLIKSCLFDIVRVDGSSMFPTLTNNDRLIVTKLNYTPQANDIIILDSTYEKRSEYYSQKELETGKTISSFEKMTDYLSLPSALKKRYYVKRIVALPGQTVDLRNGKVYIDGNPLEGEYDHGFTQSIDMSVHYPITVEEGKVFVMGDNREHSKDSRSSDLGQVPFEAIIGKSQFRIWPFSEIGKTE